MLHQNTRLLLFCVGLAPAFLQAQNANASTVHYQTVDAVSTPTFRQEVARLENADTRLHQADIALGKRIDSLESRVAKGIKVFEVNHQNAPEVQVTNHQMQQHTVRQGENLSSISRQYGVHISLLVSANNLSAPDKIFVGQTLQIPSKNAGTLNQAKVEARQIAATPSRLNGSHTVRTGENLHQIARQHGVSVDQILRANGINNPNYIRVGQVLALSGKQTTAPIIVETPVIAKVEPPKPAPAPKKKIVITPQPKPQPKPQPVVIKRPEPKPEPKLQVVKAPKPKNTSEKERVISYDFLPGDTMEQVAATFATTVEQLRKMNSLPDDYKAKTGHRILVPTSGIFTEIASN